jgi:hypothetical protein
MTGQDLLSEFGAGEARGRVVGIAVGFVVGRGKAKKQIPCCAPRQGRGGRNDNLRAFGRAWAELKVERGWVEVGVDAIRVVRV